MASSDCESQTMSYDPSGVTIDLHAAELGQE